MMIHLMTNLILRVSIFRIKRSKIMIYPEIFKMQLDLAHDHSNVMILFGLVVIVGSI